MVENDHNRVCKGEENKKIDLWKVKEIPCQRCSLQGEAEKLALSSLAMLIIANDLYLKFKLSGSNVCLNVHLLFQMVHPMKGNPGIFCLWKPGLSNQEFSSRSPESR